MAAAEREAAAEVEEAESRDDDEAVARLEEASALVETAAMRLGARLKSFSLLDDVEEAEELLREQADQQLSREGKNEGAYGRDVARDGELDKSMMLAIADEEAAERKLEEEETTAIRVEPSEKMASDELAAELGRLTACEAFSTVGVAAKAVDGLQS